MTPLLYVVRMDVQPDYLAEFVKWYDTRHAPDLIGSGFLSCSAYHSQVGGPLICNVYEVPDIAVFSSDAYVQVRKDDRQLMEDVIPRISNHSNTVYRQEVLHGIAPRSANAGPGRPSRSLAVCAPAVSTLRFDCPAGQERELCRWFAEVEAPRQAARSGYLRSRLAKQDGKHPLFPSKQPEWIAVTEWASTSEARQDGSAEEIVARYRQVLPEATVVSVPFNLAALSATLLNTDAWTS
jgi:hypothetical protein